MYQPYDVAVDPTSGKIFVADASNNRVLRFSSAAAMTNGAAAEAVLGQPNFTTRAINTTASGMNSVSGVTVDSTGILWVGDYLNNRVLRFDGAASKSSGANADRVLGQPNFTTAAENTTQSGMIAPSGVFVDGNGTLWVADKTNHRILRFDSAVSKANGGNAGGVLGQPNFTTNSFGRTQSQIRYPSDVAVDAAGTLWVADTGNGRVLRFDGAALKPNGANADGVLGQPDFTTAPDQIPTQALTASADGVMIGSNGSVWAVDVSNNRILRFDGASLKQNGAPADGILGQPDFATRTANTTQTGFASPRAGCIDATGNLFIADSTNSRVLRFGQQDVVRNASLALANSPSNGGSVAGDGTFPIGSSQQISATASAGWEFGQWSDGVTQAIRTVVVPGGGAAYTAIFSQLSPAARFSQWRVAYFDQSQLNDPTVSGWAADADFDGIANAFEFLYGTNPTVGLSLSDSPALPRVSTGLSGSLLYLVLSYRQSNQARDIPVGVQISPDLGTSLWQTINPDVIETFLDPNTGDSQVSVKVNVTGSAKKFIRLRLVAP